jgi:hypothetical protein
MLNYASSTIFCVLCDNEKEKIFSTFIFQNKSELCLKAGVVIFDGKGLKIILSLSSTVRRVCQSIYFIYMYKYK